MNRNLRFICGAAIFSLTSIFIATNVNGATEDKMEGFDCQLNAESDAAPCIQATLDFATDHARPVTLPAGILRIGRPITLHSKATIEGSPKGTILSPTSTNRSHPVLMVSNHQQNVRVRNITFDGGGVDFSNPAPLIAITVGDDVVFENISVRNSRGIGLLIQGGTTRSGVLHSRFENIGNYWTITRLAKDRIQGVVFCCGSGNNENFARFNEFKNIGLDALQVGNQNYFSAVSNKFALENGQHDVIQAPDYPAGIYAPKTRNSIIDSNNINGALGAGIDAPDLEDSDIRNNTVSNSHGSGIGLFNDVSNVKVYGNTIINNIRGISIRSGTSSNIEIANNKITDTQKNKTQKFAIEIYSNAIVKNLKIAPSNELVGNAIGEFWPPNIRQTLDNGANP